MIHLELLWNLQCIDREIASIRKLMKSQSTKNRLIEIKSEYDAIKVKLYKDTNELGHNIKSKEKLNANLKNMDQKIEEENGKLYMDGTSLKAIECMQKEIENYKRLIDEAEDELLRLIIRDELLEASIAAYKTRLSELKSQFETLKKTYTDEDERNKRELNGLEQRRNGIIRQAGSELVSQYNNIAARKINPVSKVDNGVCTECGMKLSTGLYSELKQNNNINLCSYCGRILYVG